MNKKILLSILVSILLFGCKSASQNSNLTSTSDTQMLKSDFNSETYIWEDFIFPSNKTTGK